MEENNPNKTPAHVLWVELTTRITLQPIHFRSGNEETAAESVHQLFKKTRELMVANPEATQFNALALKLLNNTLRPYTSRWHRWRTSVKSTVDNKTPTALIFKDEQVRRRFRTELKELQTQLISYQTALEDLAKGDKVRNDVQSALDAITPPGQKKAQLGNNITSPDIPELKKEFEDITKRRKSYELAADLPTSDKPLTNLNGLALSGGGIRSATFCLGIVQTLARKNLLHQFDYLSTVSGGGYLGAFISSILADIDQNPNEKFTTATEKDKKEPPETYQSILHDIFISNETGNESTAIRHLRNSSKYLGTGGPIWMAGIMLYGILVNLLLFLPFPLFFGVLVFYFEDWGFWKDLAGQAPFWLWLKPTISGYLFNVPAFATLIMGLMLTAVQSFTQGNHQSKLRSNWETITLYLAVLSLAAGLFYGLPTMLQAYDTFSNQYLSAHWQLLISGATSFLLAYGSKLLQSWKKYHQLLLKLFVLSGPLFFILIFLAVSNYLEVGLAAPRTNHCHDAVLITILLIILATWGTWLVNINTTSPHRYYRNRLCECYLIKRSVGKKVEPRSSMPLADLFKGNMIAPYHLLNTTINLTTSKKTELRGRNGDFFLISKYLCGSQTSGYYPTEVVVRKNPHLDLGTAMAISGAAASANMGWQTMTSYRFLMGLFNIRLGYWLLNPHPKHKEIFPKLEGAGIGYLFKEIFGNMNENDRYLNLSDGGHIENLAVYELLRRKCKFIVCVDGGMEPGMECTDLIRLQRYAEIDFGIRMEYDLSDLYLNEAGLSKAYAVLVKIIYCQNDDLAKAELGWMLYVKLAVLGTEPAYVLDYRRQNLSFPHQTTADQFFDEAQFEAYRMLGECAAESLFSNEIFCTNQSSALNLNNWFQNLANNLLPDNDAALK